MKRPKEFRPIDPTFLDHIEYAVTDPQRLIDRSGHELARLIRKTLLPSYRAALAEIERLNAERDAGKVTTGRFEGQRYVVSFGDPS